MIRDSLAKFFKVDSLISNLSGYVETRIEILKIEAKEEFSKGLSSVILYLSLAFVFALVIVFFSAGLALVLSEKLGAMMGFGIIAAFYLVVGICILLNREKIISSLERKIKASIKKK